jgi:hypothetical protein
MTRQTALTLYRLWVAWWIAGLAFLVLLKVNQAPSASWWLATFPLWGPPVAFVAWQLAMVGIQIALMLIIAVLRPFAR